jgi:hypothetical protein
VVVTTTMIGQGVDTRVAIRAAPLHQAGAGTAADLYNLGHAITDAIQTHGLQAGAMGTIPSAVVGCEQGTYSRISQFK